MKRCQNCSNPNVNPCGEPRPDPEQYACGNNSIRCPISPPPDLYGTRLYGCRENPANNSFASGNIIGLLSNDEQRFDFVLQTTGLNSIISAGFYDGTRGTNGPLVKTIIIEPNGNAVGSWSSRDSQPLTPILVNKLRNCSIYVNINTRSFPLGEIRGQLHTITAS